MLECRCSERLKTYVIARWSSPLDEDIFRARCILGLPVLAQIIVVCNELAGRQANRGLFRSVCMGDERVWEVGKEKK